MKKLSKQKREQLNFHVSSLSTLLSINEHWNWKNYKEFEEQFSSIEKIESDIKNFTKYERSSTVEKFSEWARENKIQADGVKITEFSGFELGLEALKDFKQNEIFVKVPNKMILSLEHIDKKLNEFLNKFPDRGNFQLAMILIVEKLKGAQSFWKPYIDILPRKYSVPLFFTSSEMEILKATQAFIPAMNLIKTTVLQYYHVYRYLHYILRDNEKNSLIDLLKDRFTFELFRWATATVMTRQNLIPSFKNDGKSVTMISALIPYWDMANHSSEGYISTQYNEQNHHIESATTRAYKKGEQIFIYYGDRNNTEMLINNGFFCNDGDFCLWIHLPGGDTDYRKDLYQKLGFQGNSLSLRISQSPNYLTDKFYAAHRIFILSKDQINEWLEKDESTLKNLCSPFFKLDEKLEKQFWQNIIIRLKVSTKIDTKDELIEDIKNLELTRKNKGRIMAMLIEYRHKELETLKNALNYVEELTKKNV